MNYPDVQFLMVNMTDVSRETVASDKEHVESQGHSFPVLFDTEYSAVYAYYVTSIPADYSLTGTERRCPMQAEGLMPPRRKRESA